MEISRFLSSAIAADGGTVMCRLALADGSETDIGLDGRIPKLKKDRVLFVGPYPTDPASQILPRGSKEEKEVIDAVQHYLDDHCGFLRREALAAANLATVPEEDRSDAIAVGFMTAILDR